MKNCVLVSSTLPQQEGSSEKGLALLTHGLGDDLLGMGRPLTDAHTSTHSVCSYLTSKLTGPEQHVGIWASVKCKPKCRHALQGPIVDMIRYAFSEIAMLKKNC